MPTTKINKDTPLTPKQQKFCMLIAGGAKQIDAYRACFNVEKSAANSIYVSASELMSTTKVQVRVEELRMKIMDKVAEDVSYDYAKAMEELDDAITFAKQNKSAAAVIAALNLKQKISGLHVEDRKNDRSAIGGMSIDRVNAVIGAIEAIKKARAIA